MNVLSRICSFMLAVAQKIGNLLKKHTQQEEHDHGSVPQCNGDFQTAGKIQLPAVQ
jgi:hypothetical protein